MGFLRRLLFCCVVGVFTVGELPVGQSLGLGQSSIFAAKKKKKKKARGKKKRAKKKKSKAKDQPADTSSDASTAAETKPTTPAQTNGGDTTPTTTGDVASKIATEGENKSTALNEKGERTVLDDEEGDELGDDYYEDDEVADDYSDEEQEVVRRARRTTAVTSSRANESTVFFTTWVGMNRSFFAGSGEYTGAVYCRGVPQANSCTATASGYAVGFDAWFTIPLPIKGFQFGASAALLQAAHSQMAMKGNFKDLGVVQLTQQTNMQYIPMMGMVRYTIANFYLALGGGYVLNNSTFERNSNGIALSTGFEKKDGFAGNALVGFMVPVGSGASLDIFLRSYVITAKVSQVAFTPVGKEDLQGDTGTTVVATPGFSFSYYLK